MTYSAIAIANAFVEKSQKRKLDNLTPMKLQKLMFFSQTWYLKSYGEILFEGYFERWKFGPVLPEIYHEFKAFGSGDINNFGTDIWGESLKIEKSDKKVADFLDEIIKVYGSYSGGQLSWMTHQLDTAWSKGTIGTIITDNDMIKGRV